MRRLLLPVSLLVSTVAVAGSALADDTRPMPVSTIAAERATDRTAAEWTVQRMDEARPTPRASRSAPRH